MNDEGLVNKLFYSYREKKDNLYAAFTGFVDFVR
jgi:hypothetical protein